MAWSTPATWTAGAVLTAAQLNAQLRDNLNAVFPLGPPDAAWTPYTPTNTNITVGNGAQVAKYTRVGRLVTVSYDLLWGSTTAFTGNIRIGVPVAAAATGVWTASAVLLDASVNDFPGGVYLMGGGTQVFVVKAAGGGITSTVPFTWVTTDRLSFSITYEAAT